MRAKPVFHNCHAQTHLTSLPPKLADLDSQKKVARIRHETQIHILNLLITSLELKTPNMALYLLGYEVKKPVSSTTLQDPGQTTASAADMLVLLTVEILAIFVGLWGKFVNPEMQENLSQCQKECQLPW